MTTHDRDFYVRRADLHAIAPDKRESLKLLHRSNGADRCAVSLISTPPGEGSPEGLHTHEFEQVFYVLEGDMGVEVDGETFEVGPGTVVVFPEGVPHRNWARNGKRTLHLAINVPAPAADRPAAKRVG